MTRLITLLCAVALVACGGDSTAPRGGALNLAIVSGQNQTVTAGSPQLGAPVVGQLVRTPDGTVAFRWMRTVGDAIVPTALAQTVVSGSPVPGAVVCAVTTDTVHKLTPFTPCTNTDSSGKATFFFTPPTAAGTATAEIRGTVDNQPAVFDTATATVTPGPARHMQVKPYQVNRASDGSMTGGILIALGDTLDVRDWIASVGDAYDNPITGWTADAGSAPDSIAEPALRAGQPVPMTWFPGPQVTFPDTGYYLVTPRVDSATQPLWVHVQP